MDAAQIARLNELQMADLGTQRREYVTTADDPKKISRAGTKELEATRECNIVGTASHSQATQNRAKLDAWSNLHKTVADTGGLEKLADIMQGQSHRANLSATIAEAGGQHYGIVKAGKVSPKPAVGLGTGNHPILASTGRGGGVMGTRGRGNPSRGPFNPPSSIPAHELKPFRGGPLSGVSRLDPALDANNAPGEAFSRQSRSPGYGRGNRRVMASRPPRENLRAPILGTPMDFLQQLHSREAKLGEPEVVPGSTAKMIAEAVGRMTDSPPMKPNVVASAARKPSGLSEDKHQNKGAKAEDLALATKPFSVSCAPLAKLAEPDNSMETSKSHGESVEHDLLLDFHGDGENIPTSSTMSVPISKKVQQSTSFVSNLDDLSGLEFVHEPEPESTEPKLTEPESRAPEWKPGDSSSSQATQTISDVEKSLTDPEIMEKVAAAAKQFTEAYKTLSSLPPEVSALLCQTLAEAHSQTPGLQALVPRTGSDGNFNRNDYRERTSPSPDNTPTDDTLYDAQQDLNWSPKNSQFALDEVADVERSLRALTMSDLNSPSPTIRRSSNSSIDIGPRVAKDKNTRAISSPATVTHAKPKRKPIQSLNASRWANVDTGPSTVSTENDLPDEVVQKTRSVSVPVKLTAPKPNSLAESIHAHDWKLHHQLNKAKVIGVPPFSADRSFCTVVEPASASRSSSGTLSSVSSKRIGVPTIGPPPYNPDTSHPITASVQTGVQTGVQTIGTRPYNPRATHSITASSQSLVKTIGPPPYNPGGNTLPVASSQTGVKTTGLSPYNPSATNSTTASSQTGVKTIGPPPYNPAAKALKKENKPYNFSEGRDREGLDHELMDLV